MNKLLSIILLFITTSCATSTNSLLQKQVFYQRTINQNYYKFGKCIYDSFSIKAWEQRIATYSNVGNVMIPSVSYTTLGVEESQNIEKKSYYINDYIRGGAINFKNWIIVVKSDDSDKNSVVEWRFV